MVPRYLVALSAPLRRPLNHVHPRPVVALHIQITGGEPRRLTGVQVPRDRQRLQENFRHDDGAAQVEHYASFVKRGKRGGETPEVAVTGLANCGPARRWMLMDDFSADRGVDGAR